MAAALLLLAVFGVADPTVRFAPVAAPTGRADPCRDRGPVGRWVPMSTADAPASLHDQDWFNSAAVWNGTRLVVALRRDGTWNGRAFDPCGNAWAPIPPARDLDSGDPWPSLAEIRPWRPAATGGTYDEFAQVSVWDVARKAWVSVKSERAPEARTQYAVALADRRLLVWGGSGQRSRVLGDGAVLDLARKTWKKMASAGAPSPRAAPAAVAWTGSRLLVWGGRDATAAPGRARLLGDGARYDPAADRWTPMSTVDAPSPSDDATVAWTGRKLVVLGGDGGVYDPATDRWTRLAAPAGIELPKQNIGPYTRILVAADGRVVFVPNDAGKIAVLDADRASWSILDAAELGKRNSFRVFLVGRRLIVWDGVTVIAEHRCPPPSPGMPLCDPIAETAPHKDGWMILLPK